jgi:hypothetical protein
MAARAILAESLKPLKRELDRLGARGGAGL